LIDEARARVAALLGVEPRRIVFTSGATEANNLALRGFAAAHPGATVLTTEIDHVSLTTTVRALAAAGTRVEILPVDAHARPDLDRVRAATKAGPCLVATSWANGESGHITDVAALAEAIADGSLLHMDAAQAAGRLPIDALGSGADTLALSAHKFAGPRGVGALVVGDEAESLVPLLTGGPQENGLRPGTENLAGIVGLGVAAEIAARTRETEAARLTELRERLWQSIASRFPETLRITPADGLPNTLTVAFAGIGGDVLTVALDLRGFAVSPGAACAAGAPEPSHVARGLGVPDSHRRGMLRMSMGRDTTEADVDQLGDALVDVIERARKAA
jgi:cysteine desulfurase